MVTVVAVGIGRYFKVGNADKADHPTAAVDAELGRVAAADAVGHRSACHIGGYLRGIDRTGAVFGKCRAAAAGEYRSHIAHIGDRDRHGLGDGMGITGLGGLDLQVVNIVAARIGRGLMVGAALPANHTAAAVDAEFAESSPPLMLKLMLPSPSEAEARTV